VLLRKGLVVEKKIWRVRSAQFSLSALSKGKDGRGESWGLGPVVYRLDTFALLFSNLGGFVAFSI